MKNILKYLMFFILLNVLSGCTGIGSSKIMLDEKNQALPCLLYTSRLVIERMQRECCNKHIH